MDTKLSYSDMMLVTQWLSPAFPVGAYSYSHGLEAALDEAPDLNVQDWIEDILRHGAGRNDAILLRAGFGGLLEEADALGRGLAPSAERLLETDRQGAAFCKVLGGAFRIDLPTLIYPVALGAAARERALPLGAVTGAYLHAFMANLVGCAQRLSPLGQTNAQAMIHALSDVCDEVRAQTERLTLNDIGGSVWAADVASMRHEMMGHRIFQT